MTHLEANQGAQDGLGLELQKNRRTKPWLKGVLTVTLPKTVEAQATEKKIAVKSG